MTVATNAQIEAVARAIRDAYGCHCGICISGETAIARAAIDAYEATRPAVAPDLPGWVDYIDAHQSHSDDAWIVRLIGYKKTRFSEQARQPGFNYASRTSVEGRGHTYANALAAALAEAGKDGQDG